MTSCRFVPAVVALDEMLPDLAAWPRRMCRPAPNGDADGVVQCPRAHAPDDGNKSEMSVGYATLYGDMAAAIRS